MITFEKKTKPDQYSRRRRRRKAEMCNFMCLVIFFTSLISTCNAIKCYVCGNGAEEPFLESSNINETFIKQKIHDSCDDFDRIPLEEKHKYEVNCPDGFHGCMLKLDGVNVQRTCSEIAAEDCQTVNKIHFCYCSRQLCNGENAESIIENLGDKLSFNEDSESDETDQEDGSGSDDEDFNIRSTSRKIESPTEVTSTESNEHTTLSVSTAAAQPTTNEAVNSHLCRNLLIFSLVARLLIVLN